MQKSVIKALFSMLIVVTLSGICAADDLTVGIGTAVMDGVEGIDEWPVESITTTTGVMLKAMIDAVPSPTTLYILAVWADESTTESKYKKVWTNNGAVWTQSATEDEDRLGIIWDMGENGTQGANCATMCHAEMYTETGNVDLWHWKSSRGNSIGYTDDTYIDPSGRHGDAGTSAYSDNINVDVPAYMAEQGPHYNPTFLLESGVTWDPFGVMTAVWDFTDLYYPGAGWTTDDSIAGYVLNTPTGSRADVESAGKYDAGTWTVEFSRAIAASAADDFIPVLGETVDFTVAEFDNIGGIAHFTDTNVHGLVFPVATAVESEELQKHPNAFQLVSSHPNPFNPETIITYQIEKPGTISLKIYDLSGREVTALYAGSQIAGQHSLTWKPANLAAGLYFAHLSDGNQQSISKMIYLK